MKIFSMNKIRQWARVTGREVESDGHGGYSLLTKSSTRVRKSKTMKKPAFRRYVSGLMVKEQTMA